MSYVCVDVDIWCKYNEAPPTYRVYLDDELLTERTFIWDSKNQYIREHIEVDVEPGYHEVKVINCSGSKVEFIMNNVMVNGKPSRPRFII